MVRSVSSVVSAARAHSVGAVFSISMLAYMATSLAAQFASLRFVAPHDMGAWQAAIVLEGYLLITQLGIPNALNREFPFYVGKGELDKAEQIARTGQAYAFGNGALGALAFVVAGALLGDDAWKFACFTMALVFPTMQYSGYLDGTLRGEGKFAQLSRIQLFMCLVQATSVALPWRFGFVGFCFRALLIAVVHTVLVHIIRPIAKGPRLHWPSLRQLFSVGWRLFVWNYLTKLSLTHPRTVLVLFGSSQLLGLFTPVLWAYSTITAAAGTLGTYAYPILVRRFAAGAQDTARKSVLVALASAILLLPFAVAQAIVLPHFLALAAPEYADASAAAQVATVSGLTDLASVAATTFVVTKAWRRMTVYLIVLSVVRLVGPLVGYLLLEDPLWGVAVGTLGGSMFLMPVTVYLVLSGGQTPPDGKANASGDERRVVRAAGQA